MKYYIAQSQKNYNSDAFYINNAVEIYDSVDALNNDIKREISRAANEICHRDSVHTFEDQLIALQESDYLLLIDVYDSPVSADEFNNDHDLVEEFGTFINYLLDEIEPDQPDGEVLDLDYWIGQIKKKPCLTTIDQDFDIVNLYDGWQSEFSFDEIIKDIIGRVGSNASFAKTMGIPLRTVEDWKSGRSTPPEYVQDMVVEKALRIYGA